MIRLIARPFLTNRLRRATSRRPSTNIISNVLMSTLVLVSMMTCAELTAVAQQPTNAGESNHGATVRPNQRAKKKSKRKTSKAGSKPVLLLPQIVPVFQPAQPISAQKPNRPAVSQSATSAQQAGLSTEVQELSNGAAIDLEIQKNPQAFSVQNPQASKSSAPASPVAPTLSDRNPMAPALGNSFEAINFNENANLTGFFQIPPDPAGAAGPAHVVNVINSTIEWYTKTGTRQNRQSLTSFFATATTPPQTVTFDPKVVYDHYANRFVVVTMERIEGGGATPNQSRVYLAVSDDSDPNGAWFFQTLITEETINARQSFADFPGLAFDSEAVYFTTNMFAHNNQPQAGLMQGQRLWIMAKAPWYTGGAPIATRYDPPALADANPAGDSIGISTTMQPTIMFGDTPGGLGTFLLAYSGLNGGGLLFLQVIQVDNPLAPTPTFTGYLSQWGTVAADDALAAFPGAPQLGTSRTIATNDRRFSQHGVYRNGLIYCAVQVRPPVAAPINGGEVTARYFVLDPVVLNNAVIDPPPTDQGNVGGEDIAPNTYTFFPAVAVDSAGNLAISFAASAPTIYPGAYFAGRLASDPPTTTRPAGALRAGKDFYIRDFTTSTTVTSRWGDYSGITVDPADGTTFWTFNEYALPRGTILGGLPEEDGRWGNAWGSFTLAAPAGTPAGAVIISEFRLRGPGGATNEFIELYNNTNAAIVVEDVNPLAAGTSGWAIVSSDNPAVAKVVVPSGVNIPARGHYLIANSGGYSLTNYPGGNNGLAATTATPDRTYTSDIPDNAGIALFRSANPANFLLADQLDAVGSSTEANPLFKEGTGYPALSGASYLGGIEYSFYRSFCANNIGITGTSMGCTAGSGGFPKDTNNNANDFVFVDTAGTSAGAGIRLGAPGPENSLAPIQRNSQFVGVLLDASVSDGVSPNRVRNIASDPGNNSTFGTLEVRRRIINNTGAPVTRLRFRIIDTTTALTSSGVADLRARTSETLPGVVIGGDNATCAATGAPLSAPCTVTVQGTALESPPVQLMGGGFNSTLSVGTITLASPLPTGASINVRFLLGVQQTGLFRFYVNVEALP